MDATAVRESQLTYCVEVAAELLADVEERIVRSAHQAQRPRRESLPDPGLDWPDPFVAQPFLSNMIADLLAQTIVFFHQKHRETVMGLEGGELRVLKTLRDLQGNSNHYVEDAQLAAATTMEVEDVRDLLEMLEGKGFVERARGIQGFSLHHC